MRYRLSEQAGQDLRSMWLYVAADTSVETADRLLEAIGDGLDLLAVFSSTTGRPQTLRLALR
jgi:plasmid stabilization system protein ParE